MTVAAAGTAYKQLTIAKIEHMISTTHSGSYAGYYPGSMQMSVQLAFSPVDGQLYSALIAGCDGVDKRIDILSSIIQRKGTIKDITEFEHAYAPLYSSAKDPVNMAGYTAENILLNRQKLFYWNKIAAMDKNSILIDVRTDKEFKSGHINNALSIPVDDIRDRMNKIHKNKNIYIIVELD